MPLSNPYGAHSNAGTGPAKNTILSQRDGRLLKVLWLDREFLEQYRANNPDALIIYRHYFGDNNLQDVASRVNVVCCALGNFLDLVDVVETPWNECYQGVNAGIAQYRDATIESVARFKDFSPDLLVCGGNWSVGCPYNNVTKGEFQDWEAWAPALEHLDFHGFHEYGPTYVMQDVTYQRGPDGLPVAYGPYVFRFQYVYDWLEKQGLPTPKVILSEFGIDNGGAGKGFRSLDISVTDYMSQLGGAAPFLLHNPHVVGAVPFCCGQEDSDQWGTFDLAGEERFGKLLNYAFLVPEKANLHLDSPGQPPAHKVTVLASGNPDSEFAEWVATPGNDHDPRDRNSYYQAFLAKREESAGVMPGVFGVQDALAGGYPAFLLPDQTTEPSFAANTARKLHVPLYRVKAVEAVESSGRPFGLPGKALIRFEAHLWLARIPVNRRVWAAQNFRVVNGVEQVNLGGGRWTPLQYQDQADRWESLELAVTISRQAAFDCTSMGRFQILGDNAAACGYLAAEAMLQAFGREEKAQWNGFVRFIQADRRLYQAFVTGDVDTFAYLYNGNPAVYSPLLIAHNWYGDQ